MREPIRAAVLAGALTAEPKPLDPFALRVPVIRRVVPHHRGPLDLDAAYFRYRVDREGAVSVLAPIAGARVCRGRR